MGLIAFLEHKPLFYDVIDYERMPRIYAKIAPSFKLPKIIHVVGTNAKGSTGRYLANALYRLGYRTGHYTSPHILEFNERIWVDGHNADNVALETAHEWLLKHLSTEDADALSYFEYTTLLAMRVFEGCEYAVLEAGLGGEHDATNVFAKVLSVFTPIGLDHQTFLGENIEAIARTKMRSMGTLALCATQPYRESYEVFENVLKAHKAQGRYVRDLLIEDERLALRAIASQRALPAYMQENMATALAAVKLLGFEADSELMNTTALFGRMTLLDANIFLDVGHNPLAAQAIAAHFEGVKLRLIYNSYGDKDYESILQHLKPILECVEIIPIQNLRSADINMLKLVLKRLNIAYEPHITCKRENTYLVFGSFAVAEAFLTMHPEYARSEYE